MGNNKFFIQTVFGGKLIAPSEDLSLTPDLVLSGAIELPLTKYMMNHVKAGQTVIDVGANIGYFSVLLGYLIGPEGKLICYEANPDLYRYLLDNLSINYLHDRTQAHQLAVFSEETELIFYQSQRYMGNSSIQRHNENYHKHYVDQIREVRVKTAMLSRDLGQIGPIDMLKIDIEGGEYHAFVGMGDLVKKQIKTVILEVNRDMLQADWFLFKQLLIHYREDCGKTFFIINDEGNAEPVRLETILEHGSFPYIVMQ